MNLAIGLPTLRLSRSLPDRSPPCFRQREGGRGRRIRGVRDAAPTPPGGGTAGRGRRRIYRSVPMRARWITAAAAPRATAARNPKSSVSMVSLRSW